MIPAIRDVPVLDAGHVQYVAHMGDDLMVVNAARVSFAKESEFDYDIKEEIDVDGRSVTEHKCNFRLKEKDKKLISYLATHQHWTPFAHPQITLRIKAPISIRTQLFKHKVGFVENEVSRRYVKEVPEWYNPMWRKAPTDGAKQGSSGFIKDDESIRPITLMMIEKDYEESCRLAVARYNKLIEEGVAPEQARFVLPQGVYTEWWWTGSLAAYARVCKQRSDPHAQWEVQQYANAIGQIIEPLFPISWKTLCFSRTEEKAVEPALNKS
jgi:thymidylate synthase (FAD)